jgi:hypothetical protein
MGKLIKQGSYYTPEMPERKDYDFQNDPDGLNRTDKDYFSCVLNYWKTTRSIAAPRR